MSKTVIARWRIKASETSRLVAMLPKLAEKTRSEPGNLLYTVDQSASDPLRYHHSQAVRRRRGCRRASAVGALPADRCRRDRPSPRTSRRRLGKSAFLGFI